MKVVLVVAGAGSMYCGACHRDATLARGLASLGHDVSVVPLYTPLRLEGELGVGLRPLEMGGLNAYLREVWPAWDRSPAFLRRAMDHPGLLRFVSRFAVRTQAADLGPMTVSMLRGPEGPHGPAMEATARAVADLVPDVVVLPNSLLIAFAPVLRSVGVPRVVCEVQGEDGFLDELPEPWGARAHEWIRRWAADVERFLAPCGAHADDMAKRLQVPRDRFHIAPTAMSSLVERTEPPNGLVVGHLSSVRHAKGLDLAIEATALLIDQGYEARLVAAGRVLEPKTMQACQRAARRLGARYDHRGELTPESKSAFLAECRVVALPSRLRESRAVVALEAFAAGRAVVAPAAGAFLEMKEGRAPIVLHEPGDAASVAGGIQIAAEFDAMETGPAYIAGRHALDVAARSAEAGLGLIPGR